MLNLKVSMEGDLDPDAFEVEVECPVCDFANPVWLKQARVRDVIICRGCKTNIQLDDQMNSVRKARRDIRAAFRKLQKQVDQINRMFG